MSAGEQAAAVRAGAGLFRLADRGLLAVTGSDRVRWLDGMLSNDVASLEAGPERSGCYAALLTRTGRIVADLHVLRRAEEIWLELDAAALAPTVSHLEKFIIADDVALRDGGGELDRLALEGPAASEILAAAAGAAPPLAPDSWAEVAIAGHELSAAAYGWSGETAFQLFAPAGSGDAVAAALALAGSGRGLVEAGLQALEILRIEAGVARFGCELDESVLPDEARLERSVSTTKGCYTGQEVVARLRSRGQVSHLLVALRAEGQDLLPVGADVAVGETRVGEVTSACLSPVAGSLALAFVRRPHDAAGTAVQVDGRPARVASLPVAGPNAPAA